MNFQTLRVRFQENICFLQFYRPEANNTINERLIEECYEALALCEQAITVIVLEGLPEVFCFGADFQEMQERLNNGRPIEHGPEALYDLWLKLATGPYITISHVCGKANAGGIGFIAASDIVLASDTAQFSLSELLFGVFPACVLPFLIRRIGFQKAHYLTLMTKPITVQQAFSWGLVDAFDSNSDSLVRIHLLRLRRLSKLAIMQYKRYISSLSGHIIQAKPLAIEANKEVFTDQSNLKSIFRFVESGKFPWED